MKVSIAAVADVHSPRYLPLFIASINELKLKGKDVDIVVLAGDIVDRNNVKSLKPVLAVLKKLSSKWKGVPEIVAIFGNEEYMGFEHEYMKEYPEILWIDESYNIVDIGNRRICIVGSRGVLMRATLWQQKNIPRIYEVFNNRMVKIRSGLEICKNYDLSMLVTHYASSFNTIYGEPVNVYKFLGYPLIDSIDQSLRPHVAIHGHSHNAIRTYSMANNTSIYNVSLPANKKVVLIDLEL